VSYINPNANNVRRGIRTRLRSDVAGFSLLSVDECLITPASASMSLVFRESPAIDRRLLPLLRSASLSRRLRNVSMPLLLPVPEEVRLPAEVEVELSISREDFDFDVRRLPEVLFMMRES